MMIENRTFEHLDGQQLPLAEEYIHCVFLDCDFSEHDFPLVRLEDCAFRSCNFTMSSMRGHFSDALFMDCKLMGADFTQMGALSNGLVFEDCCLDYANLMSLKLWKTSFRNCKIIEANFDDADLTASVFEECNLERTSFVHTNLTKVDLTTAYNFTLHPDHCLLKKTKFSENGLRGLVGHLDIVVE